MDDPYLRAALTGAGIALMSVFFSLRARRQKPPGSEAARIQQARSKGYFLGSQVRRLWDRCTHGGGRLRPLHKGPRQRLNGGDGAGHARHAPKLIE